MELAVLGCVSAAPSAIRAGLMGQIMIKRMEQETIGRK